MEDEGELDHKVIAVHVNDPEYSSYHDAHELPPHRLAVLKRFFEDYKTLEQKRVIVDDILSAAAALPVIEQALKLYQAWVSGSDTKDWHHGQTAEHGDHGEKSNFESRT
jgi:inorganic pyrophosphatase